MTYRLINLLKDVYSNEHENLWLLNVVPLIYGLTKKSSDYNRALFETGLAQEMKTYDFDFRHKFKYCTFSHGLEWLKTKSGGCF